MSARGRSDRLRWSRVHWAAATRRFAARRWPYWIVAVGLTLATNIPNPFNPHTAISYAVPEGSSATVRIDVFDTVGRHVRRLVEAVQEGAHTVVWDTRDHQGERLPSGVYYYRLAWEGHHLTGRMSLVR